VVGDEDKRLRWCLAPAKSVVGKQKRNRCLLIQPNTVIADRLARLGSKWWAMPHGRLVGDERAVGGRPAGD
jgi:hypothetical protein